MLSPARTATALIAMAAAVVGAVIAPARTAVAHPEYIAPTDFVALSDIDPTIAQDIRYFSAHNFTGARVDGYRAPLCILTRVAAEGLRGVQQQLAEQGYALKVYDCYRPQRAVDAFVRWAGDMRDQRMKAEFYPRVDKSKLFEDGYIDYHSGHSRGSTVDLTVVRLPPGDESVDMGTGFDCFDPLAHTLDPDIQGEQLTNRLLLRDVMQDHGFVNYVNEWWHFTYQPESYPDRYFDFPVDRASLN